MTNRSRRPLVALLTILSLAVVWAGLAWACSPRASLDPPAPAAGEAGSDVSISGRGFEADHPVRIRWNDENGPLLATVRPTAQETFRTTVRIPADAPDGNHVILAIPQDPRYTSRASFTVGPPAEQQAPAAPPTTAPASPDPATAQAPAPAPASSAPPAAGRPSRPATARPDARPAPRRPAPAAPTRRSARQRDAATTGGAPARIRDRTAAASTTRATATTPSPPAAAPAPQTPLAAAVQPSQATAGGDIWSGFAPGSARRGLSDAPAAVTANPTLAYGVGLLALGLLALAGGFGTVAVRRRRLVR